MGEEFKYNDLVVFEKDIRIGSLRYILKGDKGRIVSLGNPIMAVKLEDTNDIVSIEKSLISKYVAKRPSTRLDILPATIPHIARMLERGAIDGEFIKTNKWLRGTGKTTALINFAKDFDLTVIVPHHTVATELRKHHLYDKIYSQSHYVYGLDYSKCIVDEGVDIDKLNQKSIYPITGFIYKGDM